jgi:hypothetical protein
MIFGAHVVVYSQDATADRAFMAKTLCFISGRGPRMADLCAASSRKGRPSHRGK